MARVPPRERPICTSRATPTRSVGCSGSWPSMRAGLREPSRGRSSSRHTPYVTRSRLLAVAAGLALADASVVTLALPRLLTQLDATVEGVAAVIGVYTVVLALAL